MIHINIYTYNNEDKNASVKTQPMSYDNDDEWLFVC